MLLAGLQQHIRQLNPSKELSILHDVEFNHSTMFVILCSDVFMPKVLVLRQKLLQLFQLRKKTLWESGVINLDTPTGLLHVVFFYNGKNFCLRGGAEPKTFSSKKTGDKCWREND